MGGSRKDREILSHTRSTQPLLAATLSILITSFITISIQCGPRRIGRDHPGTQQQEGRTRGHHRPRRPFLPPRLLPCLSSFLASSSPKRALFLGRALLDAVGPGREGGRKERVESRRWENIKHTCVLTNSPFLPPSLLHSSSLSPLADSYTEAQHVEMSELLSFLEKGNLMR